MSFSRWLRTTHRARQFRGGVGRRRETVLARPLLERLEERITPDVGDTLAAALNTHVGPGAGSYTLASEHLGDGSYGALDVDLYSFKAKSGEALTVATSPAAGGASATS